MFLKKYYTLYLRIKFYFCIYLESYKYVNKPKDLQHNQDFGIKSNV